MGRNLALVLTPILFWVLTSIYEAWRKGRPSPGAKGAPQGGVKALVGDPADPIDPTPGERAVVPRKATRADIAEWMRNRAGSRRPSELIRAAAVAHRVSHATAKRAWALVRRGQAGGSP